jgi:ABC-type proline/glycine betaine transport system permease subunit
MAIYTPYPIILFGPGVEPGLASMSFLITGYWSPPSLGERLVAGARTLGVASVVLAITAQQWGAGGAGWLIVAGMREYFLEEGYSRMWLGYAIVAGSALIVDLVAGAIQMALPRPAKEEAER